MPALLFCGSALCQTPTWSYNPTSRTGPTFWGSVQPNYATCGSAQPLNQRFTEVGMKQAPIDIVAAKAVPAELPRLHFNYDKTALDVENTGHVVQVTPASGSYLQFGKALTDIYNLTQFHFHVPSEHTIDGKQFDGEFHLNHFNVLGEQVIVTVFLTESATARTGTIDDIVGQAPATVGINRVRGRTVNPEDLLPNNTRSYYTYAGSGTTPPCAEGVRRVILTRSIGVTASALRQLKSLAANFLENGGHPANNRPVMPLNGRTVLLVR